MKNGWVKVYRSLRDNEIWDGNEPYDKRSAWIDLLLRATHKDTKFLLGNTTIELIPGQVFTSELKLSKEWKWSRCKVRALLELLKKIGQIQTPEKTTRYTIITITNWELYQIREIEKDNEKDNGKTSKKHQKDIYKNIKNIKNKKDITKVISSVGLKPYCAVINYLNEKTGRKFDPKNKSTIDMLRARFNEGRTMKDFITVIDKKVESWLTDDKMNKYLRPSTLFNRTNFENYINEPEEDKYAKYMKKE